MRLVAATDAHFAWLLGEGDCPGRLAVPPGGVDEPWVLLWLRGLRRSGCGVWLMVEADEVVGLASHKGLRDAAGKVEIGYAVAPARRRLGHATEAVRQLVQIASDEGYIRRLVAETALANVASQRVVAANGFVNAGRSHDEDEGEMIVWRLELARR